MTTQARRNDVPDPSTIRMLQIQMEMMTVEFDKVSRENSDLKSQLNRLTGESTRRRDSNALVADKERYFKLSEHLKIEKNHLVETVLDLSNEIDVLQRKNSNDLLVASQKMNHFIEMEKVSYASRRNMEVQIIDILVDNGLSREGLLLKRIAQIMKNSRKHQITKSLDVDYIPSPDKTECDDIKILERLDAATLKSIEARRVIKDTFNDVRNPSAEGRAAVFKNGPGSIQSSGSRRKLSLFPGKKRGKKAMERDESESVISSVSTHRSGKSVGAASVSWFGKSREEIPSDERKAGGAITAENLAILNKMNNDGTTIRDIPINRPDRRPSRQQKTPGDRNINTSNDNSWWPKLF